MTSWAARSAIADYGIPHEKVHVVGVGRNHSPRVPPARDWSIPKFLFVGLDWERKNGAGLLDAFSEVRSRNPAATLSVVGGHPPIEADRVVGHGPLSLSVPEERRRLEALFEASTCFVMPSFHEPAGIVYVEAAGVGPAEHRDHGRWRARVGG